MPTLHIELDPPAEPPERFRGDTSSLVYFLSFAFAARFGAQHELSDAAQQLRGHGVDLKPLLTFADREVEEDADAAELERLWQDAARLAESCRRAVESIDGDAALRERLAEFPELRDRLDELARIASWAAGRGARVRLTYTLN